MPYILLYTEFSYPSRICDCILTEIQIKGIEYSGEVSLLTIQHPNTLILSQFTAVYSPSYPGSLTGRRGTQPVFKEAKQAFYLYMGFAHVQDLQYINALQVTTSF